MVGFEQLDELSRENDFLYDENYYLNYNGDNYGRNQKWLNFFGTIADNIVQKIQPKTVLDIGCAYGLLVECLRDRGCEAFGIDVSDYALSRARNDIVQYLSVSTMLRPIKRRYDLIVTIEVIEHIKEDDCETAIQNMCAAADSVLLATTPDDFDDPTHFNVQPPIYWVKKFAKFGFAPDITHNAGYLTPYAILFRKSKRPLDIHTQELFGEKKLQDYCFASAKHRTNILENEREFFTGKIEQLSEINKVQEKAIYQAAEHAKNLEAIIEVERSARLNLQELFDDRSNSLSWKITKPLRILAKLVDVNRPFNAVLIREKPDARRSFINITRKIRWVRINAVGANSREYEVTVFGTIGKIYSRLTVLKLPVVDNMATWLVRIEPGVTEVTLNMLRGTPDNIEFYHVSSRYAWRTIFSDRWRRGRGFWPALGVASRTYKTAINDGVGAALASFWPSNKSTLGSYDEWVLRYDGPDQHTNVNNFIRKMEYKPLISIIMPTFNSNLNFLAEAIDSVKKQSYSKWQLCIADDASTDKRLKEFLKALEEVEKISIVYRDINGHISAATNSALSLANGEFVAFLDHDDKLHPHALATVVSQLNEDRNLDILYSDEDKIDEQNNRSDPFFKPGWSPDLLLSQNYTCHLSVYRKTLIDKLNGMREGKEGAQDYDLILRATEQTEKIKHIPHILYHWRAVSGSTALGAQEKDYAHQRAVGALSDAVDRRKLPANVLETGLSSYHRIRYNLPTPEPRVSIIIPTKDRVDLLSVCLFGILEKTSYENFEIVVVDNNSTEEKTFKYFETIEKDGKTRVLKFPGEFNFSAINNFAVSKASGEIIILLNNDIEVINRDWLTELVSHAIRPGIGAVGCRLYYPDDRVQHDGIIVGMGGVAGYAHPNLKREDSGEFGRSKIIRNYSAVTAAALAVKKSIYEEVGGLDAENLAVAFNDVDFCLRVKEQGYRNVYSPFSELYHHESVSRGPDTDPIKAERFKKEAIYMADRWATFIQNDPAYNPNLSLVEGYKIDLGRGQQWPWREVDVRIQ